MHVVYMPPSAVVRIDADMVIKRFRSPEDCAVEARWYKRLPQFCPELIAHDGVDLVTRRHDLAWETPSWRDPAAIVRLVRAVHAEGVHHRDVHLRNIVLRDGEPLLIDWYTAVECAQAQPYDLYGEISGVPKPERHLDFQCWDTPNPYSIREAWGVELSAFVD